MGTNPLILAETPLPYSLGHPRDLGLSIAPRDLPSQYEDDNDDDEGWPEEIFTLSSSQVALLPAGVDTNGLLSRTRFSAFTHRAFHFDSIRKRFRSNFIRQAPSQVPLQVSPTLPPKTLAYMSQSEGALKILFGGEPRPPGLIQPLMEQISSLEIYELGGFKDLLKVLPGFPQSMSNLHSLKIASSSQEPYPTFPPGDPFIHPSAQKLYSMEKIPPHQSFPKTLKCLTLNWIPLYQSFLNIGTLTKFTLYDTAFVHSLDTLLNFLEGNAHLEHVQLKIDFKDDLPSLKRQAPIKNKLQYLSVKCWKVEAIKALVSHIPIQTGGTLKIYSYDLSKGLGDIFPDIHTMHSTNLSSPTHMCYVPTWKMQFCGPNGSFMFYAVPGHGWDSKQLSPLLSFQTIQELHLQDFTVPSLSLLPALQVLVIDEPILFRIKSKPCMLFASLQSSAPSSLKKLIFQLHEFTEDFMKQLTEFALHCQDNGPGLDYVSIICRDKYCFPGPSLVGTLKQYVLNVELQVLDSSCLPNFVYVH